MFPQPIPKMEDRLGSSLIPLALTLVDNAPADGGHTVVRPTWVTQPTDAVTIKYYPQAAAALRTKGKALIQCKVSLDGNVSACLIKSEFPDGYGFGEAAVRMMQEARFSPLMVDGKPVADGAVLVPIIFGFEASILEKIAKGVH